MAILGSIFSALLTSSGRCPGSAEFSNALHWTMILLAALTATALPLIRRLRD